MKVNRIEKLRSDGCYTTDIKTIDGWRHGIISTVLWYHIYGVMVSYLRCYGIISTVLWYHNYGVMVSYLRFIMNSKK